MSIIMQIQSIKSEILEKKYNILNTKYKIRRPPKGGNGFTLIELLIVIMIIGLLSGISLFALQGARESGRDSKRKSDLQAIASSIQLMKADCNYYPQTITAGGSISASCPNANTYMQAVPKDPSSNYKYVYEKGPSTCTNATPSDYCLAYKLWTYLESGGTAAGYCGTAPDCGVGAAQACNYCIVNP